MLEPELRPLQNTRLIPIFPAHDLRNQNALSEQTILSNKQPYLIWNTGLQERLHSHGDIVGNSKDSCEKVNIETPALEHTHCTVRTEKSKLAVYCCFIKSLSSCVRQGEVRILEILPTTLMSFPKTVREKALFMSHFFCFIAKLHSTRYKPS